MRTLLDIKNNYAQEQGYEDWNELMRLNILTVNARKEYEVENHYTEICLRAQKEALKNAAKNVEMKIKDNLCDLQLFDDWSEIDRNSITNEQNLIR